MTSPFPRNKTIGILGGGQLGRMLALAAGRLGFFTLVLDPTENCPAAQFSNRQIIAAYDDPKALAELASLCHVITYEFENIPASGVKSIEQQCPVFPCSNALNTSQDRLLEKDFIRSIGLKTANYAAISNFSELDDAIDKVKLPAILKTRRFGYDGKGQISLTANTLKESKPHIIAMLEGPCILESRVDFACEISVIAARNIAGEIVSYDPARNTHIDGMLKSSVVPCNLDDEIIAQAKRQSVELVENLQYVGVIGIEFFVTKTGELLINEFAPRVHNSGHWTEAACLVSQFEQHIRAITDLPLGSTQRHSNCVMENLIGDEINKTRELAALPHALVHDYGKSESRPGRKMGHVTTCSPLK